jgi:transposase
MAVRRYRAVLAVISDGLSVSQVAHGDEVLRRTLHSWLARYEEAGLAWMIDPYRIDTIVR